MRRIDVEHRRYRDLSGKERPFDVRRGPFKIEFEAHFVNAQSDRSGDSASEISAGGEIFPRRKPREVSVLVTAWLLAASLFVFLTDLLGVEELLAEGHRGPTVAVLGVLFGLIFFVWILIKPRRKPIAQGFFSPVRIEMKAP